MTEGTAVDQQSFDAACLRGVCARPIAEHDVRRWEAAGLLLPIANALRRNGVDLSALPLFIDRVVDAERAGAAAAAGERHTIRTVTFRLKQAGIDALVLKGAALCYTAYPAPWLRPHSDIDLLVPPGTLDAVQHVLEGVGFTTQRELSHPLVTRQRHFHRCHGARAAVDVHDALVNPPVLQSLPGFAELASRARRVPALDSRALSTPDALLHALVHRVAHHNSSVDLLWLYDMHLLAGQMAAADWQRFVETCLHARVGRIAADGLEALVRVFDSTVPADVVRCLAAARGEPSAALLGGQLTELRLQWINFRSLRNRRERLTFVRAHLAPPATEAGFDGSSSWRMPVLYVARVFRGALKWLRPVAKGR